MITDLVEVSLASALAPAVHGTNTSTLRSELERLTFSLNLSPQIVDLTVLAAENDWCPMATLESAGHLTRMSAWQIFTLFSNTLTKYFPLSIHSLADSTGFAIIHQSNGNCVLSDADGRVNIQIISPLEANFITYLANRAASGARLQV